MGSAAVHLSVSWTEPGRETGRVAAIGLARAAIDSLVAGFPLAEHGMMAVLGQDQAISWTRPPEVSGFVATDAHQLLHADVEAERILVEAMHAWSDEGSPMREAFRFRQGGEDWWAWRAPFRTGAQDLLLLIPERDLSTRFLTANSPLSYGLLVVFLVCVGFVVRLAARYRRRLVRMTRAATYSQAGEEELRALIAGGESDHLEFKSTLRWSLRKKEPAREIELAWLKTVVAFLNAEGGTLIIGVADSGRIVGHEIDNFRNDDRYLLHVNTLIQRHVGVKFARYIRHDLRPIDGKKVLVIDVLPSEEPCFLKDNEDDQFYVRIGPASQKLSLRKAMDYLREFDGR
jgi:hypothetical protein